MVLAEVRAALRGFDSDPSQGSRGSWQCEGSCRPDPCFREGWAPRISSVIPWCFQSERDWGSFGIRRILWNLEDDASWQRS